jgi:hypothetical protein
LLTAGSFAFAIQALMKPKDISGKEHQTQSALVSLGQWLFEDSHYATNHGVKENSLGRLTWLSTAM